MATSRTRKTPAVRPRPARSFADVQAQLRRPRRHTDLVLDAEAAAEVDALTELLERVQARDEVTGDHDAVEVARALQAAEDRADGSRVRFTLEAVSHRAYRDLVEQHPKKPGAPVPGDDWPFDADTFAPALVKAQLVEPAPGSDEEFDAFWEALSDGQLRQLWTAALAVQMQITTIGPRSDAAAAVLKAAAGQ